MLCLKGTSTVNGMCRPIHPTVSLNWCFSSSEGISRQLCLKIFIFTKNRLSAPTPVSSTHGRSWTCGPPYQLRTPPPAALSGPLTAAFLHKIQARIHYKAG